MPPNPTPIDLRPTAEELDALFRQKYGDPETTGWSPKRRRRFGYWTPDDVYEGVVKRLVGPETVWIDVGGGHRIFPDNDALSRELSDRARCVVGVDPSENVGRNPYVHESAQCLIEDYRTDRRFDLATLRMVAEHIAEPGSATRKLRELVRPGGHVVVLTINARSPISFVSRWTPFWLHHPIKSVIWGGEEEDTFPVVYKMNRRGVLRAQFDEAGFDEVYFDHLDDCAAFHRFKLLNFFELSAQRLLRGVGLRYPENVLLGVYRAR